MIIRVQYVYTPNINANFVTREIRESFVPRKFPAIRYLQPPTNMHVIPKRGEVKDGATEES